MRSNIDRTASGASVTARTAYAFGPGPEWLLRALRSFEERREFGEVLGPLRCEARHRAARVDARRALQVRDLEEDPVVLRALGREVRSAQVVVPGAEVGVAVQAPDLGEQPRPRDGDRVVLEALLLRPRRDVLQLLRAESLLRDRAAVGEDCH